MLTLREPRRSIVKHNLEHITSSGGNAGLFIGKGRDQTMVKIIEENERIKHGYAIYLHNAKGQDEKSIDKVMAAIRQFENSTKTKPFKKFHRHQAADFKVYLGKQRNAKTGKPLAFSTVDATLRLVKFFFHWLVGQAGFKRVLSYPDVEYFNNTLKAGRVAHAQRAIPYPSMQQAAHAFQAMPFANEFDKRNKALFAFFMLTGARDGAAAEGHVPLRLGLGAAARDSGHLAACALGPD